MKLMVPMGTTATVLLPGSESVTEFIRNSREKQMKEGASIELRHRK